MKTMLCGMAALGLLTISAQADDSWAHGTCAIPAATVQNLQAKLATVVGLADHNGGLFKPNLMWSAVVDRQGILCSVIRSDNDAWPGSRAIAIAKAETANNFSNNKLALCTANLYGPTQPGGSLYGLNNSNPFNPFFNQIVAVPGPGGDPSTGIGQNPGGIITFGGGVALYSNGKIIGGLGVSGDTSCADHAIAYRMRHLASLDSTPPNGVGPGGTDNINYYTGAVDPSQFAQPHCLGAATDITP